MNKTIRCYECKWLRTHGPCDQLGYHCALDEGCDVRELNRMWCERSGNDGMVNQLDGTCDSAERKLPELKPCPFCGGKAAVHGDIPRLYGYGYGVGCSNPECVAYSGYGMAAFEAREDAVGAWNRRMR